MCQRVLLPAGRTVFLLAYRCLNSWQASKRLKDGRGDVEEIAVQLGHDTHLAGKLLNCTDFEMECLLKSHLEVRGSCRSRTRDPRGSGCTDMASVNGPCDCNVMGCGPCRL